MAERNLNNFAQTIIPIAPNSGTTTIVGTAITSDDFPASNFYAGLFQVVGGEIIKKEIVLCSTRTGLSFAITRGANGTTAQDFTTGGGTIYLEQVLVAGHISEIWDKLDTLDTDIDTAEATAIEKPASGKTTPVDADSMWLRDSVASNIKKFVTRANIKATLKTYFDTLYHPINALRSSLGNWKIFYTNGSGVETELTVGATNTYLGGNGVTSAPTWKTLPWIVVLKTADESRTSTTVLANDSTLLFAMAANTKYSFRAVLHLYLPTSGDFKYRHTGPASPTVVAIHRRSVQPANTVFNQQAIDAAYSGADVTITGTSNNPAILIMEGIIHNGANAGNFAIQRAQNSTDPNATIVRAGSFIEYTVV